LNIVFRYRLLLPNAAGPYLISFVAGSTIINHHRPSSGRNGVDSGAASFAPECMRSENNKAGKQQQATKADRGAQAKTWRVIFEDDSVATWLHAYRAHDQVDSRQWGGLAIDCGAPA
jgi:hypothetical protein